MKPPPWAAPVWHALYAGRAAWFNVVPPTLIEKPSFPCPDLCRHCGSDVAICGESLCIAPHRFAGPVLP